MKKKILGFVTAIAMVFSIATVNAEANEEAVSTTVNIQLTTGRVEPLTVADTEVVNLDLNGQEMTGNIINNGTLTISDSQTGGKVVVANEHTILNKGKLVIENGTFDAVSHGKAALFNDINGDVTINNGIYTRSLEDGIAGSNSFYAIVNHGNMVINNGEVTQSGNFSSLLENGWYNGNDNTTKVPSQLKINGGTFTGGLNTIKNDDYGVLEITGGTFVNSTQVALMNWNVATISGGTFISNGHAIDNSSTANLEMNEGAITITGGVFKSGENKNIFARPNFAIGTVVINGGTFNNRFGENITVSGGFVEYNQNGVIIVAPAITSITLSSLKANLLVGTELQLVATLNPKIDANIVVWESSNEAVATIKKGNVKAIAAGTAVITATAGDKKATCTITVTKQNTNPAVDTGDHVNKGLWLTIAGLSLIIMTAVFVCKKRRYHQ